jgi:hypothetical protein
VGKQKKTAAAKSGTVCVPKARERSEMAKSLSSSIGGVKVGKQGFLLRPRLIGRAIRNNVHPPKIWTAGQRASRPGGRFVARLPMLMFRACGAPPAPRLPMLVSYLLGACISALIWSRYAGAAGGQLVQHPSFHPARFRRHKLRLFPTK